MGGFASSSRVPMGPEVYPRHFLTRAAPARYRWRVADRNQLSPGGAIVIGLLCGAMGTLIMLLALGAGEGRMSDGTPPWVLVCAGLAFVLAGLAIIVGPGIPRGGAPDGDPLPGTPFAVRLVQYLLALCIIAMLASIASWVAFGGGSPHLTGSGPVL